MILCLLWGKLQVFLQPEKRMYIHLIWIFLVLVALAYLVDYLKNKKQFKEMGKSAMVIGVILIAVVAALLILRKPPMKKRDTYVNPSLYIPEKGNTRDIKDTNNRIRVDHR